jgi:hypothetical protein
MFSTATSRSRAGGSEASLGGSPLVGGEVKVAEDVAFSKDCGTGCLKQCTADCNIDWEDDPYQGTRTCLVNGKVQLIASGCRRPAFAMCAGIWPGGHASTVQAQWKTPASAGSKVCNKNKGNCVGSSSGGTVSCVGPASDWLTPYTGGAPLTDDVVLRSIEKHQQYFPDDVAGHNVLMGLFCGQQSNDPTHACAPRIDPITGQKIPQTACSRYTVTGPTGNACMTWVNSLSKTDGTFTGITTAHCSKLENLKAPECACINALAQDPNYALVKPNINAPDYCWYIPCNQPAQTFDKPDERVSKCPDNCVQIIDAEKGAGITASAFIQTQNCGGNGGDGGKALLLAVTAFVVVLVLGLLLARFLRR